MSSDGGGRDGGEEGEVRGMGPAESVGVSLIILFLLKIRRVCMNAGEETAGALPLGVWRLCAD